MVCQNCGMALAPGANFCAACGSAQDQAPQTTPAPAGLRGFSPKISDPAFAAYIKKSNKFAAVFSVILAAAAIIGFTSRARRGRRA